MSENEKLFYKGVQAKLLIMAGWLISIVAFFLLFTEVAIIGVIGIVGGIFIIFKGKAQRFDYKRKSGHIIHKGDS